jgi:hypothetical protein
MTKELCDGTVREIEFIAERRNIQFNNAYGFGFNFIRPLNIRRKRLKCPKCGRKILSSVFTDEDISFIVHTIPPHKPKGWWKKHKKRREKSKKIR